MMPCEMKLYVPHFSPNKTLSDLGCVLSRFLSFTRVFFGRPAIFVTCLVKKGAEYTFTSFHAVFACLYILLISMRFFTHFRCPSVNPLLINIDECGHRKSND